MSIFPGKLKVLEALDEAYDGKANGDSTDPRSLHYEARAAKLQVSTSNTAATRKTLTKLAICSGADFVKHNGKYTHTFIHICQTYGKEKWSIIAFSDIKSIFFNINLRISMNTFC